MVDTPSIPNEPGPALSKANIWKSIFGWKALFRWDVLGAVVPGIFIAAGLGMLGIDWFPYHLLLSQICFAIAGVLCVVKIIGHAIESKDSVRSRWIFGIVLCLICVGTDLWTISAIQLHKELVDLTPSLLPLPRPTPIATPAAPISPVITPLVPPPATVHGSKPQLPKITIPAVSAIPTKLPIMLSATIVNPHDPAIAVTNHSDRVAEDVGWAMILYRASDNAFFSFRTQTIGYVKANLSSNNYEMNLPGILGFSDGNDTLKAGDDLTGSLSVDCSQCQVQTYIVHFDWGQSGWMYESPIKGGYIFPKNSLSKEGRVAYIQALKSNATPNNDVVDIVNAAPQ